MKIRVRSLAFVEKRCFVKQEHTHKDILLLIYLVICIVLLTFLEQTTIYTPATILQIFNNAKAYYNNYMPVIQQRLQQAGIRLAGLLNEVFKNGLPQSAAEVKIMPAEGAKPASDSYCDVVYGGKGFDNSGMTLFNLGGAYPNNTMTVVIYKKDRGNWSQDPIKLYDGKKICVTGKQITYQGRPEIVEDKPEQIQVK